MSITFTCACGKALQVGEEFAGREGACPGCGKALRIPARHDEHFTSDAPTQRPSVAIKPRSEHGEPEIEKVVRLTTHAGTVLAADDDLFVEAPAEIGRLYSASTTLKEHVFPNSWQRFEKCVLAFGVVFLPSYFLAHMLLHGPRGDLPIWESLTAAVVPGFLASLAAAFVVWWTRFVHTCSYVGVDGVAIFQCAGKRTHLTRNEVFLFRNAAELRIIQTRHHYNGIYTGTTYAFTWTNRQAETVFMLKGRHHSEASNPKPTDPFHFAAMAETAWTMYLLADLNREFADDERLLFRATGGDQIELGNRVISITLAGATVELRADQIKKVTVGDGLISIWEVGSQQGWFLNKGIHQVLYQDLGNARFFLLAVERLLGIRI